MLVNKLAVLLMILQQCSTSHPFNKPFKMTLFAFPKAPASGAGHDMRLQ